MKLNHTLITLLFCVVGLAALPIISAEAQSVSGVVTSREDKAPIIGARVSVVGTGRGAITSIDGTFSVQASATDTLEIRSVGYKTHKIAVDGRRHLEIILEEDAQMLETLVVTGYQSIPRDRATGSYKIINAKELEIPAVSVSTLLAGKVAGMQPSLRSDGEVGSFIIRGQSSLNANVAPLVVVDGFPISGDLSSLNPNTIESVSILKDAASASIWGTRAANGVIVVTTKKGAKGHPLRVEIDAFLRMTERPDLHYILPHASSEETMKYEERIFGKYGVSPKVESLSNGGGFRYYPTYSAILQDIAQGRTPATTPEAFMQAHRDIDNRGELSRLFRSPLTQSYNISIYGGSETMSHRLSLLTRDHKKVARPDDDQIFRADLNSIFSLGKRVDLQFLSYISKSESNNSGISIGEIYRIPIYERLLDDKGNRRDVAYQFNRYLIQNLIPAKDFPYADWSYNPLTEIESRTNTLNSTEYRVQLGSNIKIFPFLSADIKGYYEELLNSRNTIYSEQSIVTRREVNTWSRFNRVTGEVTPNLPKGEILDRNEFHQRNWSVRGQLGGSYNHGKHDFTYLLGHEMSEFKTNVTYNPRLYGYNSETLVSQPLPNGSTELYRWDGIQGNVIMTPEFNESIYRYVSTYCNFGYTFANKYGLTLSSRIDATNFVTDDPRYRYSNFWSAGLLWNVMREDFMANNGLLNDLRVRASYGYNGNSDPTASTLILLAMGSLNSTLNIYLPTVLSQGNPYLRWELTRVLNIGIDFDVSKYLYGKIDFYNKRGTDLLATVDIPSYNGSSTQRFNNAAMTNQGVDIELGGVVPIAKRIDWTWGLTGSFNKNEVTSLKNTQITNYTLLGLQGDRVYVEGHNANELFAYNYGGMQVPKSGGQAVPTFALSDGSYLSIEDSQKPYATPFEFMSAQGTTVAPVTLGISSTIDVYDFSLSCVLLGKFGHRFRRTSFNYANTLEGGMPNRLLSEVMGSNGTDMVPLPGDYTTRYDEYGRFAPYMDYLTTNAGHLRLQDLTLRYTLPKSLIGDWKLEHLSLYLQGNNLFTLKGSKEDPEFLYGTMPLRRSFTTGVKVTF